MQTEHVTRAARSDAVNQYAVSQTFFWSVKNVNERNIDNREIDCTTFICGLLHLLYFFYFVFFGCIFID